MSEQRAYTLRLAPAKPDDTSWREPLWRTHSSLGYRTPAEVAVAARLGGQGGRNNPEELN